MEGRGGGAQPPLPAESPAGAPPQTRSRAVTCKIWPRTAGGRQSRKRGGGGGVLPGRALATSKRTASAPRHPGTQPWEAAFTPPPQTFPRPQNLRTHRAYTCATRAVATGGGGDKQWEAAPTCEQPSSRAVAVALAVTAPTTRHHPRRRPLHYRHHRYRHLRHAVRQASLFLLVPPLLLALCSPSSPSPLFFFFFSRRTQPSSTPFPLPPPTSPPPVPYNE